MSLRDVTFQTEYRIPRDDITNEFFIPMLKQANKYERCSGFFSSDSLIEISYGICELIKNGGKIKLIVSPNLSEEDYIAINSGYSKREEIIERSMNESLLSYDDYFKKERLNLIVDLISKGILDIKIAFSYVDGKLGLYHEKMGLLHDFEGNVIAFSGSMNASKAGLTQNYETIDIYSSWEDEKRIFYKKKAFKELWEDVDKSAKTYDFPEAVKRKMLKYNEKEANYNIDNEEKQKIIEDQEEKLKNIPHVPSFIEIRPYQKRAIDAWVDNNYIGIFDMATGTGKTITGITAIVKLLENKDMKMGIVISVPYQHLVDQWCEDLETFGFKPIMGYSTSPQKNWKKRLNREILEYSLSVRKHFCFITTNASFSTDFVQNSLKKCKNDLLLIVDEAHNFGSEKLTSLLYSELYRYRLALSATFERHNDDIGTGKLFSFFDKKCIEYTMAEAIEQKMLCKYYYHPIPVYLEKDELEKYNKISQEISKYIKIDKEGNIKLSEKAKILLIQRSRVVAGARNKIKVLKERMGKYINDNFILVYCGATKYYGEDNSEDDVVKQIVEVQKVINKDLKMTCLQFTSEETMDERKSIINDFKNGRTCQALVAIKCLDEGVNIPSIKTAFILASSTNPKEYIQRRGRVLRTAPGKEYAVIYDFITLPRNLDEYKVTDDIDYDVSLVKRELTRVRDFASLSLNEYESDQLIDELFSVYGGIVYENEEGEL